VLKKKGMTAVTALPLLDPPPREAAPVVAVLDDDSGFLRVLTRRLDSAGWEHHELTRPLPLEALMMMRANALVVDVALLGPGAANYLEQLCARRRELAVIVCTGPSTVTQRVRGFRAGADDWITKPCHPEELIARMETVARRRRSADLRTGASSLVVGELRICADAHSVTAGGSLLDLTRRELDLLILLAEAEGRVLERERIYERVWGYAMMRGDRSVDVYVRRLRHKLKLCSPTWRYIHTHFGVGYRLSAERLGAARSPDAIKSFSSNLAAHPATA
jgi:DNA-binding response OmpR family regulator